MRLSCLLLATSTQAQEGPLGINVTVAATDSPADLLNSTLVPEVANVTEPVNVTEPANVTETANVTISLNSTDVVPVNSEAETTEEEPESVNGEENLDEDDLEDEYGENMYQTVADIKPTEKTDEVQPRPTADATQQDASYEEEQSIDPGFIENNMQLDDTLASTETDVTIEDLTGKRANGFSIFVLCLSGFLAAIAFIKWRRNRRNESTRYVSTHATFNNPVSFPDMSYNDDPL